MSANICKYCTVNNLDDIKVILVPEDKTKQEALRDDDWDNRWNWDTSELVCESEEDPSTRHLWLAECKIALSPLSDMMVIGRNKVLTIYNFKRNINQEESVHEFNLMYSTSLPGLESEETLTSILLLPFVSQQKTSINFRDWTAILIGFSTGYFRIYAENGKVLLSYLLHDEPILDIKCRSHSANNLLSEQVDEILIIYPSAVIQIDGFTLYQTLRMCRNNLAKSTSVDSSGQGFLSSLTDLHGTGNQQTPFTYKKWEFSTAENDNQMHDCANVCSYVKNDFDALVSHTITGFPLRNDSANLFFTTGIHPFVGFYRAQEGTSHTIIHELSQAVLNKVKNVFSFFSQPKELDPKEKIKPATHVKCNIGLYDERLGLKISLSPNRRLAAVVDDFGRVILFDIANAIPVRIWKGYRKAEVSWIVVEEDGTGPKEYAKQALFLVIYAPKRGILEIWCAQNGPRVTAFKVGKNCKLIYMDHVMFGLNHLILQNIKQSMSPSEFSKTFFASKCFLFNFETGELFNIDVPFLCALTDRNSKKTRDVHILKDLKVLLKKQENLSHDKLDKYHQQVVTLVLMLKTAEIRREFLDELIKLSDDEQLIYLCAQKIHQDLLKYIEKNELDFENKLVAQMCSRIMQICETYMKVKQKLSSLRTQIGKLVQESDSPPDIQQLIEKLGGWSGNDVARIFSLLAFRRSVLKSQALPSANSELSMEFSVSDMLGHFTLYYTHLVKKNNEEIYEKLPVEIILMSNNSNISERKASLETSGSNYVALDRLSRFLFNATFCGDDLNLDYLLNESCIYPSNLLLLLFTSWLHSSYSNHWCCWEYFSKPLFKIVDVMNDARQNSEDRLENQLFDSSLDDRLLAPSWTDIIELIYRSRNITSALISVNMIKALINKFKLNAKDISELNLKESADSASNDMIDEVQTKNADIISTNSVTSDNEWETLHLDKENLNLLTKQLEDLFLLDMLLKSDLCSAQSEQQRENCEVSNTDTAPSLQKLDDTLPRYNSVSLSSILTSGPGIVSEMVACWAVHHKISPELLICSPSADASLLNEEDNVVVYGSTQTKGTTDATELSEDSEQQTLMEILDHVRRCFPNCLESDILLINCCWELLMQWHNRPLILTGELCQTLNYLEKVSSSVLKHNVASMGWRLFIQKRFEILCNLIEKMGRKPKDRICRKELEMDENTLEQFITFCCSLLDFMLRTNFSSETEPLPLYMLDDWWCHFNASNQYSNHYVDENSVSKTHFQNFDQQTLLSGSTQSKSITNDLFSSNVPLAVMAMHQKMANADLIIEYLHLAIAVQFTVFLSLKGVRPLSLFSSSVRAYFFKDLFSFLSSNSNDLSLVSSDPVLVEARYKFLYSVVTAIVQTLPALRDEQERNEVFKFYIPANKWFHKVVVLTREWDLDTGLVRLRFVCDLFLFGIDPLGEENMDTVSDAKVLARQLLVIAGMRVMHILVTRFGSLDEVSFLPPNILFWLKSLVTDPNCNVDCPLPSTILLLQRLQNILHGEDNANYRICQEILSAMKNLSTR